MLWPTTRLSFPGKTTGSCNFWKTLNQTSLVNSRRCQPMWSAPTFSASRFEVIWWGRKNPRVPRSVAVYIRPHQPSDVDTEPLLRPTAWVSPQNLGTCTEATSRWLQKEADLRWDSLTGSLDGGRSKRIEDVLILPITGFRYVGCFQFQFQPFLRSLPRIDVIHHDHTPTFQQPRPRPVRQHGQQSHLRSVHPCLTPRSELLTIIQYLGRIWQDVPTGFWLVSALAKALAEERTMPQKTLINGRRRIVWDRRAVSGDVSDTFVERITAS